MHRSTALPSRQLEAIVAPSAIYKHTVTMTMTDIRKATGSPRVQLHCRVDTVPLLRADAVTLLTGAVLDVVAVAYVAVSPDIRIEGGLDLASTNEAGWRESQLVLRSHRGRVERRMPLKKGLAVARQEIRVVSVSYRNPLDVIADLGLVKKTAGGVSGFINELLNGVARRRSLNAATETELINNAVLEATMDVSVDERYAALESAEFDNALKRERLKQAKIETKLARLKLAREVHKLHETYGEGQSWTIEETEDLLDNSRVIQSVELMGALGLSVSVNTDNTVRG